MADFVTAALKTSRNHGNNIFNVLRENDYQPRTL